MLLWADWVGSKWSRKFFSFFKLNNKQKPFERTLLELLGTKYGFSAPLKLNKFFEKSKKIDLRKVFLQRIFWRTENLLRSIFRKTCFTSKKAQNSRILSPEALIECVRKVFAYSLILKTKKFSWSFWTHQIRPCLKPKNTFFQEIPYWLHITYQISSQPPK